MVDWVDGELGGGLMLLLLLFFGGLAAYVLADEVDDVLVHEGVFGHA